MHKKAEEVEGAYHMEVEIDLQAGTNLSACGKQTSRVHDYRMQKTQHLKVFERTTYLFYRKRRWYLKRYLDISADNYESPYELKEAFRNWFEEAKSSGENRYWLCKTTIVSVRWLSEAKWYGRISTSDLHPEELADRDSE